jgi:hypothetical protein
MIPLARLAREELAHFEEVIDLLRARGGEYRRLPPSPYAARLMTAVRTHEPARLLDTLLCCALIEARSCERMRLLAEALDDPALKSSSTAACSPARPATSTPTSTSPAASNSSPRRPQLVARLARARRPRGRRPARAPRRAPPARRHRPAATFPA